MIPQPFRLVAGPGARNGWCLQMARVGNCLGVWSAVALSAMLVACAPLSGQTTRQEDIHQHAHDVMPFDLSKTVHIFKMTEHGGVQRVVTREAGTRDEVALIQQHLMHEAARFQNGNYTDPATLHGTGMPGIKELQEGAPRIKISYAALPDGAEITFETTDLHLVTAVHRWFGAQLSEHGADARTE